MTASHWDGLSVTEVGAGPGVLWLHGYTMRAAVWQPLWDLLPGWRHVGIDLPWHGSSRSLRPEEDLGALADTVVSAAARTSIAHVVALSFGTVLAAEMAIRHPQAFESWTLAAPALAGMPHEPTVERRYVDLATLFARHGPGPHMTRLWMTSPPATFAGLDSRPDACPRVRALIEQHEWRELRDGGMRRLVDRPQRAGELAAVETPVLVVLGERDLFTHRACARSIAAAVPSATVRVMPGCGHLALLEDPGSAAALVGDHLRRVRR
ncbi:alpha/beta fold hydrolase [Actinopolymorpha pittospori]|uniref:Pimeloyl-ACP methyl ester carboxylesterase n=1 Tax=Actinopolymorpha pittospori TaxID=648752 RepID=A0A927RAL2_9ACTN|nr:alpha/beta hydrolase [Actinopolymorpha pittospori]MBE1609122.1 pimeloyl-ACP methyl ester carboxylesterase [Actinopolymorpha pittospori]